MESVEFLIQVQRRQALSANDHLHWRAKAKRVQYLRFLGKCVAQANRLKRLKKARLNVYVATPRRIGDVANWHPTVKPLLDGFIDYGLLPDDSDKYLEGPFLFRESHNCLAGHLVFRFEVVPMDA